jgi:hypothetical protein
MRRAQIVARSAAAKSVPVRGPSPLHKSESAAPSNEIHNLYIKSPETLPAAEKEVMLEMLRYIHTNLPIFAEMGVSVKINKIRPQDLQNSQVMAAFSAKGITRLPALTTSGNVYIGFKEIRDLYERNIAKFQRVAPQDDGDDSDILERFYRSEMTKEHAEADAQEKEFGEGDDMMDSYRKMLARREKIEAARPHHSSGGSAVSRVDTDVSPAQRRPPAQPSMRDDNIARHYSNDDDEINDTIRRLASDINPEMRAKAFASKGGDSLEDDGAADPQDDLMERAYWARIDGST